MIRKLRDTAWDELAKRTSKTTYEQPVRVGPRLVAPAAVGLQKVRHELWGSPCQTVTSMGGNDVTLLQ